MDGPCCRFVLDYYTDINRSHDPAHRYCQCGWTQAHHYPCEPNPYLYHGALT